MHEKVCEWWIGVSEFGALMREFCMAEMIAVCKFGD